MNGRRRGFSSLVLTSCFILLSSIALSQISLASTPQPFNPSASGEPRLQATDVPQSAATLVWLPIVVAGDEGSSPPASGPAITHVETLTPNMARYEKFEIQFDVSTGAANLDLPFDPNPPPGVQAGVGISVDAEFSHDNWKTVVRQPAFLYQPYAYTLRDNQDHFTPDGPPRWRVRFAPQAAGTWQYRLRAQDADGTTVYPAGGDGLTFTVNPMSSNPYTRRGFLHVSPTDARYFEFQDGTPFVGVGFDDGFTQTSVAERKMRSYEQNKMNFMRIWLSGAGINGSQWTPWATHFGTYDGYMPSVNFDIKNTYQDADVAMKLDDSMPCMFGGYNQGGIPVEPSTTYHIEARVRLSGVTGPAGPGDYGFVIKLGDWLDTDCVKASTGRLITTPIAGNSSWITVDGSYTTAAGQYWLGNLYLVRQNATGGVVYIDEVHLWRADDPWRSELLHDPYANSHLHFDPMSSASWDNFIALAEQRGVYLKLVIDEKNEWIRNHIGLDGAMTATDSNDNFYAAPGTKVRWLQQAWWRYLIARWGYSTAVHSFEYVNEGDPYNGHHYEAANAMARYFHEHDPSRHMVTTSLWHSFPNVELWSNPDFADLDYADLHAYVPDDWGATASFLPDSLVEARPEYIHSGNASAHILGTDNSRYGITPRGLVIRGPGEWLVRYWMKTDRFAAQCPYGGSGGMQHVRWIVDGGTYWGGLEGVVPGNSDGLDFVCTSPAGTFDWTQFRSDRDRSGNLLPEQFRIVLKDNRPHEISLWLENANGVGGEAWIDDVELVSPAGEVTPVIGQFDVTRMDEDTAWYNRAYGDLLGAKSPVGALKPLVRGEAALVADDDVGAWNHDLAKDQAGVWLHNNVWGQIGPAGMTDLFWWSTETIPESIYYNYATYRTFMEGIPLNNGLYRDANAQTSRADLRAWGQRDDVHGRMHLWVQNTQHTWKRVVFGPSITPIAGTITLPNVPAGTYRVTWWDTYHITGQATHTEEIASSGKSLVLTLPYLLADDVAVKVERLP